VSNVRGNLIAGKVTTEVELSAGQHARLMTAAMSGARVRLIVDEDSILEAMRRQPFDQVQVGNIIVPIYMDQVDNGSGGKEARYRFPKMVGGVRKFSWSKFLPVIKRLATEHAEQLKAVETTGQSSAGQSLATIAVDSEIEANLIGKKFYQVVSEHVQLQLALNAETEGYPAVTVAEVVAEAIQKLKALKRLKPALVSKLAEEFVDVIDKKYENDPRMRSLRKRITGEVKLFIEFAGTRYISEISDDDITFWYDSRLDVSEDTARQYRSELRKFFNWARDVKKALPKGKTAADAAGVKHINRVVVKKAKTEAYDAEEMTKILQQFTIDPQATPWLPTTFLWGCLGIHFAEIAHLTWGDIDFENRTVTVTSEISGRHHERIIPVSPANFTFLEKYGDGKNPTDPIMPLWYGDDGRNRTDGFRLLFKRCLTAAGVTYKKNGLRHSFASNFFVLTYNLERTAHLMGSHPDMMYAHYLTMVHRADAVRYFCISIAFDSSFDEKSIAEWLPNDIKTHADALAAIEALKKTLELKEARRKRKWAA